MERLIMMMTDPDFSGIGWCIVARMFVKHFDKVTCHFKKKFKIFFYFFFNYFYLTAVHHRNLTLLYVR